MQHLKISQSRLSFLQVQAKTMKPVSKTGDEMLKEQMRLAYACPGDCTGHAVGCSYTCSGYLGYPPGLRAVATSTNQLTL